MKGCSRVLQSIVCILNEQTDLPCELSKLPFFLLSGIMQFDSKRQILYKAIRSVCQHLKLCQEACCCLGKAAYLYVLSLPEEVLILFCGNFVSNVVSTVHSLFNELFMRLARQLIYRDSVLFFFNPIILELAAVRV